MKLPWRQRSSPGTFARSPAVRSVRHGERTVLMDLDSERYFSLDEVAGRIWDLMEEPRSISALATDLSAVYDAPVEEIELDVAELLANLSAEGLVRPR
jgi:hypothetical protein